MMRKSNINVARRWRAVAWLLASAATAVLLSGATAMAQSDPQLTGPDYRVYRSHIDWQGDCVPAPSVGSGQTQYRVYPSHVAWRNGEVAADPTANGTGQEWELFTSHVDHYDTCSLHPITMSAPPPSYSWSDVKNFIAGLTGQQG